MKQGRIAAVTAAAVVVIAAGAGLYLSGSPGEQRLLRLDERRTQDLWSICEQIDGYWRRNGELPRALDDVIVGGRPLSDVPADPVTGESYEYEIAAERGFILCADFARASEETTRPDFWRHESGRWCFSFAPATSASALRRGPTCPRQ